MAEVAVSFVIDRLTALLNQEVKLLSSVGKQVADIRDELESIRAFLKDVDQRAENEDISEGIKTWVKQLRTAAYRIEDAIDEYMIRVERPSDQHGFKLFLSKVAGSIKTLKQRHVIGSEVQDVKTALHQIKERSQRYGFNISSEQGGSSSNPRSVEWHDPRIRSLFIEEDELVGIESPRDELVGMLTKGTSKRTVISVVGMGGLGKTTLTKKVYDNLTVAAHFDCHAWITVSQSYKMEDLLQNMLRQFHEARKESAPQGLEAVGQELLIRRLIEYLHQKRYVVVFDDVWKPEFWAEIEYALPDYKKGSRIVITTRSEDVAPSSKESPSHHVYKLQPLPPEKAWELFCKKVFQSEIGYCPPELLELSEAIVERCEGLPLAIVTIGGLMSTKDKVVSEWRKFIDSLGSQLASNPRLDKIKRILLLSYYDLPYNLKSCLLYFGMFPEDYSINCARLIRLWVAEGFVKGMQGITLEAVAEDYLTELINRSMVQVDWINFNGKARSVRVHDLMHEIILSRSEEMSFHHASPQNALSFKGKCRHLSIRGNASNASQGTNNTHSRSVILFDINELPKSLVSTISANFKLLRVMDFESAPLEYIPKQLGNLLHLRYLSIRSTRVKKLPKSIGKLHNLETLDFKRTPVNELPFKIDKLPKLRNLLGYFVHADFVSLNSTRGVKIHGSIGQLESLQKLCYLDVERGTGLIDELGRLKQLKRLGITNLRRENGVAFCAALEKMSHLESLIVSSRNEAEYLELHSLSSAPPLFLQRLHLQGRLERLPEWVLKLKSLVRICLNWTRLVYDPLKVLQVLPNLLEVSLYDGYDGEQLHFEKGCFQKLKVLWLGRLQNLDFLTVEDGAMPLLEEFAIGPCPRLTEVPSGILSLRNLKTLEFVDMRREFMLPMLPDKGQENWKVKHIPTVLFSHRIDTEQFRTFKLGDSDLLQHLQLW